MTQEELTKYADVLERIQGMSETDIMDMPYEYTIRLIDSFNSELLIRELVARGHNKDWQTSITTRLKNIYQIWLKSKGPWNREDFQKNGRGKVICGWLESINYDVYSHRLITSEYVAAMQAIDEEETDDEELENEELEDLREQVEKLRNQEKGISIGINQAQAALFGLSLANTFGFNYTNKKKDLAPLLHKLFGWGETKIAKCLSEGFNIEERNELANLFKDLCPPLYRTIMNKGVRPPEETSEETPGTKKFTPPQG